MHGIGCDIIEISRVKSAIEKHGRVFLNKLFTENEQLYCEKHRFSEARYAARFAAKEAISKALGTGFGELLSFLDIEITSSPSGKPEVKLSDHANERFSYPKILISLSHSKTSAMAFAVVE